MAIRELLQQTLSSSTMIYLTSIILLSFFFHYCYSRYQLQEKRRQFKAEHGCQPASSNLKGDPFGLSFSLPLMRAGKSSKTLEYLHDLHLKHGRTVMVNRGLVLTSDGVCVRAALSGRFGDWAVREARAGAAPLLGQGIFTTDGPFWAHSRALLRPPFERSNVQDLEHFEGHVESLLRCVEADGGEVDLQDLFYRFAMDASTELLFGTSTGSLRGEGKAGSSLEAFDVALGECLLRGKLGLLYWVFGGGLFRWRARRAVGECKRFVDEVVARALEARKGESSEEKGGKGKVVFIEELAKDERVDAGRIRDEAMNVLTAGRDSTAGLLSLLWFQLARRPDVWAKLRAEVDGLGSEKPSYEQLMGMRYLKYCVQETLRLYPPVPVLSKKAIRDTVLPKGGGEDGLSPLFVAKGTILYYNMHSMHHSIDVYGHDVEDFRPERWADPALKPGWDFLPFGGGPRICLGQQYALTETYYVTVRLMQKFRRVDPRGPEEWREKLTLTLGCMDGVHVALMKE